MAQELAAHLAETVQPRKPCPLRFRDTPDGQIEQLTPPAEAGAAVYRMIGVENTGSLGTRLLSQVTRAMEVLGGGAPGA